VSSKSDQPNPTDRPALEASLALVDAQRTEAIRSLRVNPVPILAAWGVAWLVGFGGFYLASSKGPGPFVANWVAALVLGALFAAAVAMSVGQGVWHGRGVEGPSRRVSAMYGWSWGLGFAGLYGVIMGLSHAGLPSGLLPLAWSGGSLLVVGLLYLTGGIVWGDNVQYGLGVWTLVVGTASVSAGVPGNFLVLSLAGGGGLLAAAGLAQTTGSRRSERLRADS